MDNYNMPNDPYNSYRPYNSYSEEEEKAPNLFQQFAYAFVPPKYNRLAKVKTGSMIGFVTLFVLLFVLLSFAKLVLAYTSFGGVERVLDELPEFSLKNGVFSIEEDWYFDEGGTLIYITDEVQEFSYADVKALLDEGYENVLLVARKGMYLYNQRKYQELDFSDTPTLSFDKRWIAESLMPIIWTIVAVAYLFLFVGGVLWYFACAALYLLVAMLIALIMSKKIPAGKLFRTAVYSKVFMYVIVKVIELLPLPLPAVPFLLRLGLTLVFLGFAIYYTDDPGRPVSPQEPFYGGNIQ